MAITFIISGSNGSTDSNTAQVIIDTSGANFVAIFVGSYGGVAAPALTDSKNASPAALTEAASGTTRFQIYYVENANCGTGHQFDLNGTGSFCTIGVMAFGGVATASSLAQQISNALTTTDPTIKAGPITDPPAHNLIITGMSSSIAATAPPYSCDSGFTPMPAGQIDHGGNAFGVAAAYKITTSAEDPEWTIGGGANSATNASFIAGSSDILHPASVM